MYRAKEAGILADSSVLSPDLETQGRAPGKVPRVRGVGRRGYAASTPPWLPFEVNVLR